MKTARRPGDLTLLSAGVAGLAYALVVLTIVTSSHGDLPAALVATATLIGIFVTLGWGSRLWSAALEDRKRRRRGSIRSILLLLVAIVVTVGGVILVSCFQEIDGESVALSFSLGAQIMLFARRRAPGHGGLIVAALLAQALLAGQTLPAGFAIPALLLPIPLAVMAMAVLAARQARALPPGLRGARGRAARAAASLDRPHSGQDLRLLSAMLGLGALALSIILALLLLALPVGDLTVDPPGRKEPPERPAGRRSSTEAVSTDPDAGSPATAESPPPVSPAKPASTAGEAGFLERLLMTWDELLGKTVQALDGIASRITRGLADQGLADGGGFLTPAGERVLALTALGILLQALLILWMLLARRRRRAVATGGGSGRRRRLESYYYEQLLSALAARGIVRRPPETLLELAHRAARVDRETGILLVPLAYELYAARFGKRPLDDESRRRLVEVVRALQQPRQTTGLPVPAV